MATHIHKPGVLTYYIILNNGNVVTYGQLQAENCLDTPYDNVETFINQDSYKTRLTDLGVDLTPTHSGPMPLPIPGEEI